MVFPSLSVIKEFSHGIFVHAKSLQSCLTLCDPMDCSPPGFPILHHLPEFAKTHVHWVGDGIQPSHSLPASPCPQSFPASGSFLVSWLFSSDGQSIGASASALVLPMNIQDGFYLGLTGLISLQSRGLSGVFQYHSSKILILRCSAFVMVQVSHPYMTTEKP